MKDLTVGQAVVVVAKADRHRRGSVDGDIRHYKVAKVGRKYFYAVEENARYPVSIMFHRDNGREAGNFSHRRAYRDEAHYRTELALEKKLVEANRLKHAFSTRLERLDEQELDQLIALLKKAGAT